MSTSPPPLPQARVETFWLVVNYGCNNRCIYCYAEPTGFDPKADMPLETAQGVINEMAKAGARSCILIGGEPTMYPHLEEVVRYGTSVGVSMKLVTNGRRLADRDRFDRLVAAGLDGLTISFEASNPALFREITKVSRAWDDTTTAIRHAVDAGFSFGTLTTVHAGNASDIIDIGDTLHALGARRIGFNFATPNCTEHGVDTKVTLRPDHAAQVIEDAFWKLDAKGIGISFLPTLPLCAFSVALRERLFPVERVGCGCHVYTGGGAVFDSRGNLIPCTHLTEFPMMKIMHGDGSFVWGGDFNAFWNDPAGKPAAVRREVWKYATEDCSSCNYFGKCIGGCPIFRAAYKPIDYIPGHRKANAVNPQEAA